MHSFKLVTSLADSFSPQWEQLVQSALAAKTHHDRVQGFKLSREAMRLSLLEFQIVQPISDLKLDSYHRVFGLPHLTISLSHTKNGGAALIAERKDFRSVGIDMEDENRLVKDSIRSRIAHSEDDDLKNIELWCVKEAVFKSIMNTDQFEKPIEFNSIKIGKGQWLHTTSGLYGTYELKNIKPFLLALAYLKN